MAGIDLTIAESKLALWLAAEEKLASAQSTRGPDGQILTRADLAAVAARIDYWDARVKRLSAASGGRTAIGRVVSQ